MMEMAQTLWNECSFLFLTTCENHPFIGLSTPYITADGQHTFRKQSINNRTLRMMNRLLLNADINGFKFCEREECLTGCR